MTVSKHCAVVPERSKEMAAELPINASANNDFSGRRAWRAVAHTAMPATDRARVAAATFLAVCHARDGGACSGTVSSIAAEKFEELTKPDSKSSSSMLSIRFDGGGGAEDDESVETVDDT